MQEVAGEDPTPLAIREAHVCERRLSVVEDLDDGSNFLFRRGGSFLIACVVTLDTGGEHNAVSGREPSTAPSIRPPFFCLWGHPWILLYFVSCLEAHNVMGSFFDRLVRAWPVYEPVDQNLVYGSGGYPLSYLLRVCQALGYRLPHRLSACPGFSMARRIRRPYRCPG